MVALLYDISTGYDAHTTANSGADVERAAAKNISVDSDEAMQIEDSSSDKNDVMKVAASSSNGRAAGRSRPVARAAGKFSKVRSKNDSKSGSKSTSPEVALQVLAPTTKRSNAGRGGNPAFFYSHS